MADLPISPVRDPNYQGFNYSDLLDRAAAPLDRYNQGRLAIAQQQGQRTFELAAQQANANLLGRNRIAEIQAEEGSREQFAKTEALRQKNEIAAQKFATAKQIDPSFKPDPEKSLDENMAAADRVKDDVTVAAYKAGVDTQAQANADYLKKLKNAGIPDVNPTQVENIVGSKLAADPDFIRSVSPAIRQQLANGTLTANQVINNMVQGRFTGWAEGLGTGFNPNATAQNLAQKAQQYRQDVITSIHQSNLAALGAEGQQLQSRFNQQNDINQRLLPSIPAYRLGEVMQYQAQNKPSGGLSAGAASLTNPDGTLKSLNPPGATPPPPVTPQTPNIPPPAEAPPGTPSSLDPAEYRRQADLIAASTSLRAEQQNFASKQEEADNIRKMLTTGQAPVYGNMGGWPGNFTQTGTRAANLTPAQGEMYATKLLQLKKDLEASTKRQYDLGVLINQHMPPAPPPGRPGASTNPGGVPNGMLWNPDNLTPPTNSPPAQGAPQPQPGAQPSAMNNNPFQQQQAHNLAQRVLGTGDPAVWQAAQQFATTQMGMSPDAFKAIIQSAFQGDPNATQTARSIIARVSGGNGQPQMQTPDQSFAMPQQMS